MEDKGNCSGVFLAGSQKNVCKVLLFFSKTRGVGCQMFSVHGHPQTTKLLITLKYIFTLAFCLQEDSDMILFVVTNILMVIIFMVIYKMAEFEDL